MQRRLEDVMTTDVVAVDHALSIQAVTDLLAERHISGAPVVDPEGRVVGVVSETDLLKARYALNDAAPGNGGGRTVGALMTSPAITASPTMTVSEAAKLMHGERVNRLPVVDAIGDHLIGIVTRADLLKVFDRSDESIQLEILDDVLVRHAMDPRQFNVTVRDGVVVIEGRVQRRSLVPMVTDLIRRVQGVVDVHSRLGWELDDFDPVWPSRTRTRPVATV